jgi:protein tyrosine/serine phosphatase
MPQFLRYGFGFGIAALIVCVPIGYAHYRQAQVRHFRVVRDGVLYRSGQTSLAGLQQIVHDYGIRTVVTLRDAADPKDPPPDQQEEIYCEAAGIKFVRIPPRIWWAASGPPPAEKGIRRFRDVMDDPDNYPVLIHCFAGIHRTGAFCAVYRMEYEHWTNAEAITELSAGGYINLNTEWDVLNYLEEYQPRWRQSVKVLGNHMTEGKPSFKLVKRTKKKKKTAE